MNKSVKKLLAAAGMAAILCAGTSAMGSAVVNARAMSESEKAAQIQQLELLKYRRFYGQDRIRDEIRSYKKEIKKLEKTRRDELDGELAYFLQLEEDLVERINLSYFQTRESSNLNRQLTSVRKSISQVVIKINANNNRIRSLKKKIEQLDNDYAVLLQNQEAQELVY